MPARMRQSLAHWVRLAELEAERTMRGMGPPIISAGDFEGHCLRAVVHALCALTKYGRTPSLERGDREKEGEPDESPI